MKMMKFAHDEITFLQGTNDFHSVLVNLKVKLILLSINKFSDVYYPVN